MSRTYAYVVVAEGADDPTLAWEEFTANHLASPRRAKDVRYVSDPHEVPENDDYAVRCIEIDAGDENGGRAYLRTHSALEE